MKRLKKVTVRLYGTLPNSFACLEITVLRLYGFKVRLSGLGPLY